MYRTLLKLTQTRGRKGVRGVTLVEMAIVVLIIGIILGAILAGRTIMSQARWNKFVKQIDETMTAVATYKEKYSFYPGDDNSATTRWQGTSNGNGNGYMNSGEDWALSIEHMAKAGLVDAGALDHWSTDTNRKYIKVPFGRHTHFSSRTADWNGDGQSNRKNMWRIANVQADIAKRLINERDNGEWNRGRIQTNRDPATTSGRVHVDIATE